MKWLIFVRVPDSELVGHRHFIQPDSDLVAAREEALRIVNTHFHRWQHFWLVAECAASVATPKQTVVWK